MLCVTLVLLSLTALLNAMELEGQTAKVREGESFTFHIVKKMDEDILWSYGYQDPRTLIAQIDSDISTEYCERFRDKLQLDIQTGSLTIKNATVKESGIYQVEIIGAKTTKVKTFQYTVYAPVTKPVLSTTPQPQLTNWPSAVLVVCSVKNGKEVTLSWYRGNALLNETSSPDSNITLRLPLMAKEQDAVYSCVAANPVSNQTVLLQAQELNPQNTGPGENPQCCCAIVVRLVLSALVAIIMVVLLVEHFTNCKSDGIVSLTS